MRITILPKTGLGWWSVGLAVAFILFFIFVLFFGPKGEEPTWQVALTLAAWGTLAAAAFVTGLIDMIRSKECSIFVILIIELGVFLLIIILGEFIVLH